MTPIEVMAAAAIVVVVLALAGAGGGWLLSRSELLQDAQDRWSRAADVLDAALHGELLDWEERWQEELAHGESDPTHTPNLKVLPYGMIAIDSKVVPEIVIEPGRWQRLRWRTKWVWYGMLRCNLCSGWHVIEVLLVAGSVALVITTPAQWWQAVLAFPPLWLASGGLHTIISGAANNKEIW